MMKTTLCRTLVVALAAFAATPAVSAGSKKTSTVKVTNQSAWVLHELYMSPSDSDDWGPDQLGKSVIGKGQSFTLTDVPCRAWDLRLVDEDGDVCVLEGVDLCAESATWDITNEELLSCQASS